MFVMAVPAVAGIGAGALAQVTRASTDHMLLQGVALSLVPDAAKNKAFEPLPRLSIREECLPARENGR